MLQRNCLGEPEPLISKQDNHRFPNLYVHMLFMFTNKAYTLEGSSPPLVTPD